MKRVIAPFICICLLSGCSLIKQQVKGEVSPKNFNEELSFTTAKTVIVLPVMENGGTKNFLFDTGADLNLVQRDSILGKTKKYEGASKRQMKLGKEVVGSMKIGHLDFKNTVAVTGDFKGLKEQIPNFGGLIGQPIINKANWLIDYPNKTIQISNEHLTDTSFTSIIIKRKGGAPYTIITIGDKEYEVLIDTGSSSAFNLPRDSKLAKELLNQYEFEDNQRERYTLGGLQTITEKAGVVALIKLGGMEFTNVKTTLNTSSQPRIGISFFENCKIYIDNIEGDYKIKKVDFPKN